MIKALKIIIFGILINLTVACQNKTQNTMLQNQTNLPEFKWEENLNCPPGYPIEVYRGGLEGNVYVSLSQGTSTGIRGWGASGAGMSYGIKPLPSRINCIWVSYAEGCLYKIDSPIDYDKLVNLFREGYPDSNRKFGKRKRTFSTILVGFAPGGVVVIWAMGAGRQVEIGRYKGEKYQVPAEEIAQLDNHESLLFSKNEYKRIMHNTQIVPLAVREANEGQPIPYGLWDSYRSRYTWRPTYVVRDEGGKVDEIGIGCFNGERENLFDESLVENKFEKRAIPDGLGFGWKDKNGQDYGGYIKFEEKEIFTAFQEVFKDDKDGQAELQFTINYANNFVTAQLKQGGKEIRLTKTEVTTYKSTRK
jgi:hypothetical protein